MKMKMKKRKKKTIGEEGVPIVRAEVFDAAQIVQVSVYVFVPA